MNLSIKGNEELKKTYVTYVIDWNDPQCKEKIYKAVQLFNMVDTSDVESEDK